MRVAVLGAGAWGLALSIALERAHEVTLWTRDPAQVEGLVRTRQSAYLPGLSLPGSVRLEADAARATAGKDLAIVATSTAGMKPTLERLEGRAGANGILWACKGFDPATGLLPHELIASALPGFKRVGALSGPSFAIEVARGLPAALTVASLDDTFATASAAALNGAPLRVYSSTDLVGVEVGGALKNVMAIAAGISDGLGLGANARAALVTRGLAEMARLGMAMGGSLETFMGLAGIGDLVLTATGDLSRNRTVGLRLAAGMPLDAILEELGHVAEGVHTARSALALAARHGVSMPITEAVSGVLFEGLAPKTAVQNLLAREAKREGA